MTDKVSGITKGLDAQETAKKTAVISIKVVVNFMKFMYHSEH